jgi:hypothetical protein
MKYFIAAFLLGLAACGSSPVIGNGLELLDGGGSKLSLSRDGSILISYTVTGHGKLGEYDIIENRPNNSSACEYYSIGPDRQLVQVGEADSHLPISVAEAARAVRAITSHSCRSGTATIGGAERNSSDQQEAALMERAIARQAEWGRTSSAAVRSAYTVATRHSDGVTCVDLRYRRGAQLSFYCFRLQGQDWTLVSERVALD